MSHSDAVSEAPAGFAVVARTTDTPVAAFEDLDRRLAGVQFHPEVLHTEHGQAVLEHFLYEVAGLQPTWTMTNVIDEQVAAIRAQVGDRRVVCGLSGGVDSAVAAALVQRAVGDQLTCVFVDHGLLRKGEAEQVERDFVAATGVRLKVADASKRFLDALAGVSDPEEKRKAIGREFIRVFEEAAREVVAEAGCARRVRRLPGAGHALPGRRRVRRRHRHRQHQVPPQRRRPARRPAVRAGRAAAHRCSRTRCARSASSSGCPRRSSGGSRSPGRASGIRIVGEVTQERLDVLREADAIAREELTAAGLDREIWQCPVVLLGDVRSVGVQGDERTYGHPDRAAAGVVRGRDDRRLDPGSLRRAGEDLDPDHQRGARGQPGHARHHVQAARHHRVGVTVRTATGLSTS